MKIPSLNTKRLILRAFETSDVDPLFQILAEEEVLRYFPNPKSPPREKVDRLIQNQLEQWEQYGYAWWAVTLASSGELIGWCGLQFLPETGETEVGYLLGKPWWGKGYATEAASASLNFAFQDIHHLDEIIALVHPDNQASIHVIEKIGLHFVDIASYFGMVMQRYRITKHQFKKENIQEKSL
jgi:[ribosomal protein S5]-alanine N-acetyltransferase